MSDESFEDLKREPDENENEDPSPVEKERPNFKPFFFLGHVVRSASTSNFLSRNGR